MAAVFSLYKKSAGRALPVIIVRDLRFCLERSGVSFQGQMDYLHHKNELVMGTDACRDGHPVYPVRPGVWCAAGGGAVALDTMLPHLAGELLGGVH